MAALIEVRGLEFCYPDGTEALCGVNLELSAGETLVMLGANGSGKTTLLLHLNGLLQAAAGQITVCGLAMTPANYAAIRDKVGFVFQDSDDQLFMPTVIEDVAYGLLNRGLTPEAARAAAHQALLQVDLTHAAGRAPYHLSGGEKRRAALAGVLAMQPEILVFDEPTTALDPPAQRKLAVLMTSLEQAKIVSTHDAAFARAVGTRAVFFEKGKVAGEGPVDQIIRGFDWEAHLEK
jgi:energy-coupling factor transporter ATP-binding protein EcfA2